jgi:hypothetical protein
LQRTENRLSLGRLILFLLSLGLFYVFFSISIVWAVMLLAAGLFTLGWLVSYQNRIIREKEYQGHLAEINRLELKSLDGDYYSYGDGTEYMDKNHPYIFFINAIFHVTSIVLLSYKHISFIKSFQIYLQ